MEGIKRVNYISESHVGKIHSPTPFKFQYGATNEAGKAQKFKEDRTTINNPASRATSII